MKKYDIGNTFTTANTIKITVDQTGSREMIREKDQAAATPRCGFRVRADGDTIGFGSWGMSEKDLLLQVIKQERYTSLAYQEAYYGLLQKLGSIGLVLIQENEDDSEL